MPDDEIVIRIRRFDPSTETAPREEAYRIPRSGRGMTVIDALDFIRDNLSSSLAYRWFCGVKKCGLCSVMINGRPALSCWEPVQHGMVVEPLRNFPVVKDLVIDRSKYDEIMLQMKPHTIRAHDYPGYPEPIRHEEMLASFHASDCIECLVCMAACPVLSEQDFESTPPFSGFIGPAPLVRLAKYQLDPRDGGDRSEIMLKGMIEDCGSCNECSVACPKEIDVLGDAIDGLRNDLVMRGVYHVRGWSIIRRLPRSIRKLAKCTLHLSFGEGPTRPNKGKP